MTNPTTRHANHRLIRVSVARIAVLGFVSLCLSILFASPAAAQVDTFRILLKNGNTFTSSERPQVAHFDESKVLVRSQGGHVIALNADEIEKVESDLEFRGYGVLINKSTILVGYSANDNQDIELDPAIAFGAGIFGPSLANSFASNPFFQGTDAQTVSGPVTAGALQAPVLDIPN